jgi:hypothetical protein
VTRLLNVPCATVLFLQTSSVWQGLAGLRTCWPESCAHTVHVIIVETVETEGPEHSGDRDGPSHMLACMNVPCL